MVLRSIDLLEGKKGGLLTIKSYLIFVLNSCNDVFIIQIRCLQGELLILNCASLLAVLSISMPVIEDFKFL